MIFVEALIQGVLLGGLYALFAAGLSLVFGIMRLVNLAHGDLIILAAFVILSILTVTNLHPLAVVILAAPLMFGVGWVLQTYLFNQVLGGNLLRPLLVTFGLSIILQNGLLEVYSADSQRLPAGPLEVASISLGPVSVGVLPVLTFVSAVLVILALNWIFFRTRLGRAFRATSDDQVTASLMGISPRGMFAMAMGLAMIVITIAAVYLGMRSNFDPSVGPARLLYAFEAVIIGGLGSFWGTLAGGVIIGSAQTVGAAINPEWQILAGHIVFLIVLMIRPRGLFPKVK